MNQLAVRKSLAEEIYRSGDSDYMVSLARGLHVIQVFCDDGRRRLTIADVTRISGLSRTVVARCLYTLQELGFVDREGRYFFLLPKVLKLGYGYVSTASLPTLAQPILDELTATTNSSTAIVVLDNDDVLYVAKSGPQSGQNVVTMTVSIGHRRPAYVTASGLVLLAHLPTSAFDQYIARLDEEEFRRMGTRSVNEITGRVEDARKQDFAQSELVFATSMRAIAVPVRNVVGNVIAAMVIAVYDEKSSHEELAQRFLPLLRRSASELSDKLVE